MVYSTNPDFQFEQQETIEEETLAPEKQKLVVAIDKKGRAGKQVTAVTGFVGKDLFGLYRFYTNKVRNSRINND